MIRIQQTFDSTCVGDVRDAVACELLAPEIVQRIKPGDRVAVCAGSRGIHQIAQITAAVIQVLQSLHAHPFLVPAMGSHGCATAQGQRAVLASYGITEQTMGVPIDASMETIFLGDTQRLQIPVHFSKTAYQADWILPINRVKAHTDFFGPIESGLNKMLAIGLGKEIGCTTLHRCGTSRFADIIPEVSRKILSTGKVRFGLAIVENGYDHTAFVRAVKTEDFLSMEPELLKIAKQMMPHLPFSSIDVLVVERFGKDISGSGMDPNITGRMSVGRKEGYIGPEIQRIVVLSLTPASHGNAIALNAADFITREVFAQIDLKATYKNSLACCNPISAQIPVIADTAEEAISMAIACCRNIDPVHPRIVRIRSTLALDELLISDSLLDEARNDPRIKILG